MNNAPIFLKCDFHIHTYMSECAKREMLPNLILEKADIFEIEYIGITDHYKSFSNPKMIKAMKQELSKFECSQKVYVGCEADILGVGRHYISNELISELDYVAVSANHFHCASVDKPKNSKYQTIAQHHLDMFKYACSLKFVDIIVHPFFVFSNTFDPTFLEYIDKDDLIDALKTAKENDIAMEISPRSLDPEQLYFKMEFYRLCKEVGLKFSIGSDAHRLETIGKTRNLQKMISDLDITEQEIWLPKK